MEYKENKHYNSSTLNTTGLDSPINSKIHRTDYYSLYYKPTSPCHTVSTQHTCNKDNTIE